MPQGNRPGRQDREGATLDRVRVNEVITQIAFGGRRRLAHAPHRSLLDNLT